MYLVMKRMGNGGKAPRVLNLSIQWRLERAPYPI